MMNQFVNPVNQPFWPGPLPNSQQRARGQDILFARGRRDNISFSTESGSTKSTRLYSHITSDKKVAVCTEHTEFSASRSSSVFPEKLGKVDKQSLHFRVSEGISDSMSIRTISNGTSQLSFNELRGNCHSGLGNSGNAEEKGAIKLVQANTKNQFLSSIFIVPKKDSGHLPMTKLNKLNKHIPYIHFKMEDLFLLKEMLKGDYMCKIDLKDAYFSDH